MTWWGQDHLKVSRFCIKKEILRFHLIVLYSNFPDKLWKQFVKNSFWCIVQNCFERLWTSFGDPKPIAAQPSCPSVNVLQLLEEILRDAFYTNLDQSWNYTLRAKKAMELCSEKMDHHHWRMSASHYKWFLVKNCCKSREILKMNLCFVNFALDLTLKMVHWYWYCIWKRC